MRLLGTVLAVGIGAGAVAGAAIVQHLNKMDANKLKEKCDETSKKIDAKMPKVDQDTINKAVDHVIDVAAEAVAAISVEGHHIINDNISQDILSGADNMYKTTKEGAEKVKNQIVDICDKFKSKLDEKSDEAEEAYQKRKEYEERCGSVPKPTSPESCSECSDYIPEVNGCKCPNDCRKCERDDTAEQPVSEETQEDSISEQAEIQTEDEDDQMYGEDNASDKDEAE